jgi:dynein heavy chain
MVWVDPKNLGYRPFYERWVRQKLGNVRVVEDENKEKANFLMTLYDKVLQLFS